MATTTHGMTVAALRDFLGKLDGSLPILVPGSGMAEGAHVPLSRALVRDRAVNGVDFGDPDDWPEDHPRVKAVTLD